MIMITFYLSPVARMSSCDFDTSGYFYICTKSVRDLNFLNNMVYYIILDSNDRSLHCLTYDQRSDM